MSNIWGHVFWCPNRFPGEAARNAAEFVDIMHLASTDDIALVRRLVLHAEVTNRGRQFFVDRKREALESAALAREAVTTALASN